MNLKFCGVLLAAVVGVFELGMAADGADGRPHAKPLLTIDFGDGSERRFTQLELPEKGTVLDLLLLAAKHPRGITVKHRGQGETAFVTEIEGVKNEGGGKKNWRFQVNGRWADRSCGVYSLAADDAVLWIFDLGQ